MTQADRVHSTPRTSTSKIDPPVDPTRRRLLTVAAGGAVDPIELPTGRKLVTLRDAANYLVKFPKAEQQEQEWQTAAEVLMLIGEHGGDPTMARIAMMRALYRRERKAAPTPRQKRAKVYKVVR
jgi:hypothetical protein